MKLSTTTVILFIFLGLLTVFTQVEKTAAASSSSEEEKDSQQHYHQKDFDDDNDDDDNDVEISDEEDSSQTRNDDGGDITVQLNYESPIADPEHFYFAENFDNKNDFNKKWIKSQARKDDIADEIAKYDGEWELEEPKKQIWKNDLGLVLKSKAKHAAISSKLSKSFVFDQKPLIVQYEVTMQDGQNCGGSYLKLLSAGKETEDLTKFNDKTPYTIMFGPDKCGNDIKLHFIFRHVNPINGSITEKHSRKPRERLEEPFKDKLPHLYQLLLRPDNTFEISVDHRVVNKGSLLSDVEPPVNPPKEINDPNDKKPDEWDEREKIPDPTAQKPEDWDEDAPPQIPDPNAVKPADWLDDEEEMIPDPNAKKPEDWDTEMDGDWEPPLIQNPVCETAVGCGKWKAPLVSNPDYKGKWRAPLIDNPNYQGKWSPKKIPNPDFFEDLHPFKMTTISAVGIEIWSMSSDILFDNILITDDAELAKEWAAKTFDLKRKQIDKDADTFIGKLVKLTNDNPYLWGVYILIVGVPLAFAIYSLCFSKNKENEKEKSAKAKKTDESSPDDKPISSDDTKATTESSTVDDDIETIDNQEDNENNEKNDNEQKNIDNDKNADNAESLNKPKNKQKSNTSPKSKKSDLEVENNTKNSENINSTDDIDDNNENLNTDNNIDEIEEISTQTTTTTTTTVEGARKRKPRRE